MKVLIASADHGFYNSSTLLSRRIALSQKANNFDVHMLYDIPSASQQEDFIELQKKGVTTHHLKLKHFKNISEFIRSLRDIRKIVRSQKIEAILCMDSKILDLLILALLFVKTPIVIRSTKSGRIDPLARLKYLNSKVKFIISPYSTIYRKLLNKDKIPKSKVIQIYDDFLRNYHIPENDLNLKPGIDSEKLTIGLDSEGWREHKLESFMDVFCSLAQRNQQVQFRISGLFQGHPLSHHIPESLKERFVFIDRSPCYLEIFKGLDIFVSPEIDQRGINSVNIFAAANGVALVGFNVGANEDLIIPGETGWLIDKHDFSQLNLILFEAVKNRESILKTGQNARELVLSKFTENVMINQYQDLFNRIGNTK